jgi:Ferritin-like domain
MMSDQEELSRGEVMFKGALAVGAIYGAGAIGPYVRRALAAASASDIENLNLLLRFEYLQAELYDRGVKEINDKGEKFDLGPQRGLIRQLADEEKQHVEALTAMIRELGGEPDAESPYAFAFRGVPSFLPIASSLERSALGAYGGAIPLLESKAVRRFAGSIVQVEGRHQAAINMQIPEEPAPEAFEKALTPYSAATSVLRYTGSV